MKPEPQRASATNATHWRLCLHSGTFKIASDFTASADAFAASAAFTAAYKRQSEGTGQSNDLSAWPTSWPVKSRAP